MKDRRISLLLSTVALVVILAVGVGAGTFHFLGNGSPLLASPATAAELLTTSASSQAQAATTDSPDLPTQQLLADLYDTISPSVVNIQVTTKARSQAQREQPSQSEGTGFVYDNDGHIVTNSHVVADATQILVNFADGRWAKAELVARDPQADLAVIKVAIPDGVTVTPLVLDSQKDLNEGHYVVAIGSPFGLDETMTLGVVSALGRSFPAGDAADGQPRYSLPDVIQTDAAINPGNSGGPLLNLRGEVVGVNFAINSPVRANSGVGFAIPVSVVEKIVPALIDEGAYRYSFVGLSGQTIDAALAADREIADNTLGIYVAQVVPGGPADSAGVQADDIVVGIDEQSVVRFEDLLSYLFNSTVPGQRVTLHILRDGQAMSLELTLAERPGA
ncbi:MAG: PDZ domain-containing protein [Chloroflexi bacterium]|nr:MAG: PDZ domain-containing protein [Chloroflexota bacterium]